MRLIFSLVLALHKKQMLTPRTFLIQYFNVFGIQCLVL